MSGITEEDRESIIAYVVRTLEEVSDLKAEDKVQIRVKDIRLLLEMTRLMVRRSREDRMTPIEVGLRIKEELREMDRRKP